MADALEERKDAESNNERPNIHRLKLFWSNFIECENEETKVRLLELFIFEYHTIINAAGDFNPNKYGFLSNVPSQLTCYMLQLVYGIICSSLSKSDAIDPLQNGGIFVEPDPDNMAFVSAIFANNHDLINNDIVIPTPTDQAPEQQQQQPKLSSPAQRSDITAIVALREFLIHGIGGRILELFLKIDTKNMLSARELASLVVHLFPTNAWDIGNSELMPKESIEDFECLANAIAAVESVQKHVVRGGEKNKSPTKSPFKSPQKVQYNAAWDDDAPPTHTDLKSPFIQPSSSPKPHLMASDLCEYETVEFKEMSRTHFTCDYIGSLVLNLCGKLVTEESISTCSIDRNSVTIQCFNFAIESYCTIGESTAFFLVTREILQRRLLTIMYSCLANILMAGGLKHVLDEHLDLYSFLKSTMEMFHIECNRSRNNLSSDIVNIRIEHISSAVYFIFLLIHKSFVLYIKDEHQLCAMYRKLNDTLKQHLHKLTETIHTFVQYDNSMLIKLLIVIFKVIRIIRSTVNHNEFKSGVAMKLHKRSSTNSRKNLKKKLAKILCTHHHHQHTHELGCIFESMLLQMCEQATLRSEPVIMTLKFFQANAICCCTNSLENVELLLNTAKRLNTHKQCLNYVKNNVLKTIFSNVECASCDTRRINFTEDDSFVRLYRNWLSKLVSAADRVVFLKHIAKLSKYFPFEVSFKIFVDIVLPSFRQEKQMLELALDRTTSNQLIINHLNIFLSYLNDLRLIKGFYNDENIQHMEDLIVEPEFASLVCCLLKIGLDNESFLGEFCGEQIALAHKLEQLKQNVVLMATDVMVKLFYIIGSDDLRVRPMNSPDFYATSHLPNKLFHLLNIKCLTIQNVLHLTVVYWNMILQVMRSKVAAGIEQEPLADHLNDALITLVYNSLICFLYAKEKPVDDIQLSSLDLICSEYSFCRELENYDIKPDNTINNVDHIVQNVMYPNRTPHSIFDIQYDIDYNDVNKNGGMCMVGGAIAAQEASEIGTLHIDYRRTNSRNSGNHINDSCSETTTSNTLNQNNFHFIYDIRTKTTHCECHCYEVNGLCQCSNPSAESNSSVGSLKISTNATVNNPPISGGALQNLIQFFNENIFEKFFATSNEQVVGIYSNTKATDCNNDGDGKYDGKFTEIFDPNELVQVPEAVEYKRLFLQLFEITCGVMMMNRSKEDNRPTGLNATSKMPRQSLQELKSILLKHSLHANLSIENGAAIISALQSLLKIAEMRYKCCFVEDCAHATYSQVATSGGTSAVVATNCQIQYNRMTSIMACVKDGGDNQCCSAQNSFDNGGDALSSDIEQTEEEEGATSSDDTYLTADEGYDGDAELANTADTDLDESDINKSASFPTSRYRNYIVHEDICRIVIDILIELSKRCLDDPTFWPNYLMQIASRFGAVRESIGGSLYLIKGFTPILECNDMRLRDFQKSILELITDINTPETMSAYLSIMTSYNPPVDVLLPRFIYLGGFSYRLQPSMEIRFPTVSGESFKTTCDPLMFKEIKQIHDYHEYHRLRTAFTRATYIIPLDYINFRTWAPTGFTATMWIQIQPGICGSSNQQSDFSDLTTGGSRTNGNSEQSEGHVCSTKKCSRICALEEKTHLLSIGSNNLLLSIYLNSHDMTTLYFQLIKPNAQIVEKKLKKLSRSHTADVFSEHSATSKSSSSSSAQRSRSANTWAKRRPTGNIVPIHNDLNHRAVVGSPEGNTVFDDQLVGLNVLSTTCQAAIKSTRIAIINRFSQFSLFTSSDSDRNDSEFQSFRYPLEMKGLKLPKNKWAHLGFSVLSLSKEISIRITIDGFEQHDIHLPCALSAKNDKFQILCIGDKVDGSQTSVPPNGRETSNLAANSSLTYSLSNVHIFQKCFTQSDILSHLVALGPDCINLTNCQIGNLIPNFGYLNLNKSNYETIPSPEEIGRILRDNFVGIFSATDPHIFLGYNQTNGSEIGERMGVITFGDGAIPKVIPTLQSATILCGGLSPILYLFARIVELSTSEFIQASALSFLLRIAHTNSQLYSEFQRRDYISLIGPIIRSSRCIKGIALLNSILEVACDQPILTKRSEQFYVITTTNACIVYGDLLVAVINRYSDWHTIGTAHIIEMLLAALQALVREKHPKQQQNILRLTKAGLIPAIFHFCKFYLVGVPKPVRISTQAATSLVNLVSIFAGAPPSSSLLDEIVKVLLLLHRPSDSFITHDRSKFYFLLSSLVLVKPKRLSLPLPIRVQRGRKSVTPIKNRQLLAKKFPRSISLDLTKSPSPKVDANEKEVAGAVGGVAATSSEGHGSEELSGVIDKQKNVESFPNVELSAPIVKWSKEDGRTIESTDLDRAIVQAKHRHTTSSKKRTVKRIRHPARSHSRTTTDSETENKEGVGKKVSVSSSGFDEDMTLVQEYDIIASDDIRKLEDSLKFIFPPKAEVYAATSDPTSDGVIQIQNGFFDLLKDFILILPDTSISEVLTHYVTVDVILVMANHSDVTVRSSIIRLLAHMCQRLNAETAELYMKNYAWHHLGNQVALYQVNSDLVQVCCQWITGSCLSMEQMLTDPDIRIVQKLGLHVLIAILPQTVHDLQLIQSTFELLDKMHGIIATPDQRQYIIECGLLPSLGKALSRFYQIWGTTNEKTVAALQTFLCTIALKAILTAGTIKVLWDLLNSLTFIGQQENVSIFRGIRTTQANILNHLLESFIPLDGKASQSVKLRFNISEINLANSTLSMTEKKTRFDLLIDRIVQFITNVEPSHQQTDAELKLIENAILLSCTGYVRGSNVIPWSLCPSRTMSLKMYTIKTMLRYSTRNGQLPALGCDGKMVKAMVQSFLITDRDILPVSDLDLVIKVCHSLGILSTAGTTGSSTSNLAQTLEKLETMRQTYLKEQKPSQDRTVFKFEPIVQKCIDSAMKITRDVVELQNMERRILMNDMRSYDESGLRHEWNMLIERMTHEGAPWYCSQSYPRSWKLDETEGPSRARVRLKRYHLTVDPKFLMTDVRPSHISLPNEPLAYLRSSLVQRPHFALSDQVLYTFSCRHLPMDNVVDGEMIVTESHLIFLANAIELDPIQLDIVHIMEIWPRRYQHCNIGLEFNLETNNSMLFVFQEAGDRDILVKYFSDKVVQCPDEAKMLILMQQWKEGQLTNWDYIMALNQISGRTYQDLMQYPIFPWILADYENGTLNLNDPASFRVFGKPIAVQYEENEQHYITNFNYLKQAQLESGSQNIHMIPYHYGSHYSNSGTVLHFLVRVPPYTNFFLHYQDNSFDLPDRTFHSLRTTWRLASRDSPTDVKELIPEFFTLPEMFENYESFDFGLRQNGERVNHVALPPWCSNSHRLFVLIHRQALECGYVRSQLNRWIDLVFGYKQTGSAAVEAINVFHPATYIGFSTTNIADPTVKIALETMVRTYGQMPRQLFHHAHPESNTSVVPYAQPILPYVKGLRWGIFTGSPQLCDPIISNVYEQFEQHIGHLISMVNTNVCYAMPLGCNVMQGCEPDTMNVISWRESDGIVRIRSLCGDSNQIAATPLVQTYGLDEIVCCGSDPRSNQLWLGHRSGKIAVHQCYSIVPDRFNKNRFFQHSTSFTKMSYNSATRKTSSKEVDVCGSNEWNAMRWKEPVILTWHTNEVTGVHVSVEFKVAVSVSMDGVAVIWDTNRLNYVRCIQRASICNAPISLVTISPTLGDILTIHAINRETKETTTTDEDTMASSCFEATESIDDDFVNVPIELTGKSLMRLHTINATYINHVVDPEAIRSCTYSYIREGTGINVIITGYANSMIRLWSSWDLSMIKEIHVCTEPVEVVSLTYSTYQHLVLLTNTNVIQVWHSPGLLGNTPKFPQKIFHKRHSV